MDNSKNALVQNIKEWVKLDNEIRSLKKEENIRKTEKKKLNENIMNIMRENEIDCIDIKDGQICYNQKSVKKPITKTYLLEILSKYFNGDSEKADHANEYILNNREEVIKESIVRKINK